MGLGKTIQILGWLSVNPGKRPAVIVTPANAKYNWADQIKQHTKMKCQILSGRTPHTITKSIIIINYDILFYWTDTLINIRPKALVLDECHYIKNRTAKRTKACKILSKNIPHIIPMSGTPIINRPVEFFPVLNIIQPKKFSSFWKFAFRYCAPKRGWQGRGWDFSGADHLDELQELIKPFLLRRMKKDVLTQLPTKRRTILPVEINNKNEYEKAKEFFLQWYKKKAGKGAAKRAKKAQALVKLGQLKQLTAEGKLSAAYEWIDNFLFSTKEKLVVFVYHKNIFNALTKKYKKIATIGGKSGKERQEQVRKFQTNSYHRLFIGTIKADKESITLTAASTVLFIEIGWTPSEHDQAEDRVNRIGQTDNKINVYYLLGRDTIDQYVWSLIENKRKVIDQIMNKNYKSQKDVNNVLDIIQLLKGKKK
jgi:SWI/SNF-related matrix-associated actin-dependent regulator 1 of chromatin subfamily A